MESFKKFLDKKTLSPEELARKHKRPLAFIQAQLEKGIAVEKEHSSDENVAREIALAHLGELDDYYDRLAKMEKK